jgi:hypothetical protein
MPTLDVHKPILHLAKKAQKGPELIVMARGRADATTASVSGTLTPTSGPGNAIQGTPIWFVCTPTVSPFPCFWMLLFRHLQPGTEYELSLTAVATSGGTSPSAPLKVATPVYRQEEPRRPSIRPFCSIQFPGSDGEHISQNDFVANGDTDYPESSTRPVALFLENPNGTDGTQVTRLSLFWDYTDLHIWSAQFDTLALGSTYHLQAFDDQASGADRHGLVPDSTL